MIDRELRRRIAEDLAAFMRGELTDTEYQQRTQAYGSEIEVSLRDSVAAYALWPTKELRVTDHGCSIAATHRQWQRMLRTLAILESNLRLEVIQAAVVAIERPAAVWSTMLILYLGGSVLAHRWLEPLRTILAMWFGVGVTGAALGGLRVAWRKFTRNQSEQFAPFNNEAQWSAHQHLVLPFNLPAYDPSVHEQRRVAAKAPTKDIASSARFVLLIALGVLLSAPFVGFELAFGPQTKSVAVDEPQ